jgi:CheY-like chemotaxis protein
MDALTGDFQGNPPYPVLYEKVLKSMKIAFPSAVIPMDPSDGARRVGIVLSLLGACAACAFAYSAGSQLWKTWREQERFQALLATPTVQRATGADWSAKHPPGGDKLCGADLRQNLPPSPGHVGQCYETSSIDDGTLRWTEFGHWERDVYGATHPPGQVANAELRLESFAPRPNRDGIVLISYDASGAPTSLELTTGEKIARPHATIRFSSTLPTRRFIPAMGSQQEHRLGSNPIQGTRQMRLARRDVESNTAQRRILIVDDEPTLRRILRVSLASLGFETEEASTGEQALELLGANHYDLVLLDVEMPGMGGIETCKEIQGLCPRPAVVMVTVRDAEDDKAKAFEAGAVDYLTKPYRLRDLVERIRAVLDDPSAQFRQAT